MLEGLLERPQLHGIVSCNIIRRCLRQSLQARRPLPWIPLAMGRLDVRHAIYFYCLLVPTLSPHSSECPRSVSINNHNGDERGLPERPSRRQSALRCQDYMDPATPSRDLLADIAETLREYHHNQHAYTKASYMAAVSISPFVVIRRDFPQRRVVCPSAARS